MRNIFQSLVTKKELFGIYIFLAIILGSGLGYFAGLYVQKETYSTFLKSFRNIREDGDTYAFINPLVGTISSPATDVGLYTDIKNDITSYLKTEKFKGNLYDYSYYFRDLSTGLWYGDNDAASFFPASLFKFPIAIAVYKQIEDNPGLLKTYGVYTQALADLNASTALNSDSRLVVGTSYSVEELTSIMILESDNGAKNLLLSLVDVTYLNNLFKLVSAVDHEEIKPYEITSRKYAHFLRMLYGSTYLNEEHSELILSMLSKSDFKDALPSGVPGNIPVAHKYGVYEVDEVVGGKVRRSQQLHDCGIVYHFENPYVFCFMTKGKDLKSLIKIISDVSRMVYKHQDNN
jgi:beta-lactamase class A